MEDEAIGHLQLFYKSRLDALRSLKLLPLNPHPPLLQSSAALVLLDGVQNPALMKMGSLGQIAGGRPTNAAIKEPKEERIPHHLQLAAEVSLVS